MADADEKDRGGGGGGSCPHCGVDPATEPCGRLGWCKLTPAQMARISAERRPCECANSGDCHGECER